MNALALVTQHNNNQVAQWQFDKIMSAIAYDLNLSIVFMDEGIEQFIKNPAWKCLDIYGINNVFCLTHRQSPSCKNLLGIKYISTSQLKKLIKQSQIIL